MLELQIEGECVAIAERAGWFVRKVSWPARRGAPDRVFIKGGRTVWIEFKRAGKSRDPLQVKELNRMVEAGAVVRWDVVSVADFRRILGL